MPEPIVKLPLVQIADKAYQISHKDQNLDLDLTIWEKTDERGPYWTLNLMVLEKIPSDPCTSFEECDYRDEEEISGIFKPCSDCSEKSWAPSSSYEGAASYEQAVMKANKFLQEQGIRYVIE